MMTQKMHLTRSIEIADAKAQYDEYAKRIVADKTILAWIAKYTVQELKEYSIPMIVIFIKQTSFREYLNRTIQSA